MPPFLTFLLAALLASLIKANEILSETLRLKRSREMELEQSKEVHRPLIKRQILFCCPPSEPTNPFKRPNPPDLFRSISDAIYYQKLPADFKEFARIFRISWHAHEVDFFLTGKCNFELMDWEKNPKVTALSFETHLDFILQILKQRASFKSANCWDLLEEYINFTFTFYSNASPSSETFANLLIFTAKALNPRIFKTLLKHRPVYFFNENANPIWFALIQTALERNLVVSNFSQESNSWVELFYLLSSNFGPFNNLITHQASPTVNTTTFRLNQLLKVQPIISALANHDADLFMFTYVQEDVLTVLTEMGNGTVVFWFNRFLTLDESFKRFNPAKEQKLSLLADKMYVCICATYPLHKLLKDSVSWNFKTLPQFILMYSTYARNSISSKQLKCLLLQGLVQVDEFNFDYMDMVTIIVGFDLKWADLEENLLPNLEIDFRDTPLIQGLKFILQVAESFPAFDPSVPWKIPLTTSPPETEINSPFLYDAGRIILARHFKILPSFTDTNYIEIEEACYSDLAWFITFYLNLYRPDLGPDYEIRIVTE